MVMVLTDGSKIRSIRGRDTEDRHATVPEYFTGSQWQLYSAREYPPKEKNLPLQCRSLTFHRSMDVTLEYPYK